MQDTFNATGFFSKWKSLVMSDVTSHTMEVIFYRERTQAFHPGGVLRQGKNLPLLYCMGNFLKQQAINRWRKAINHPRQDLSLSHLFKANNLILN